VIPTELAAPASRAILVVEDDLMVRELTRQVLVGSGFRVLVASPERVVPEIRAAGGQIALLLTDVVMPRASGPEVADWVRGLIPGLPATGLNRRRSISSRKDLSGVLEYRGRRDGPVRANHPS
jgi:CheY-like chemotaxis protein